jgi:hypothetical protein
MLAFSGCNSAEPTSVDPAPGETSKKSVTNTQAKAEPTSPTAKSPTNAVSKTTSERTKAGQPKGTSRDPFELPAGGAQELVQFIEEMRARRLEGKTIAEQRTDYGRTQKAIVAALDKLLRGDIDPELRLGLTNMKLNSLSDLMRLQEPNAKERFYGFAREAMGEAQRVLLAANDESLRAAAIELRMNALMVLSGQEGEPSREEFLKIVGEHTGDKNPRIARAAIQHWMDFHLRDVDRGKRTDGKPIVETMKSYLSGEKGAGEAGKRLTANDLGMTMLRLGQLEQIGLTADARALHREALSAFSGVSNEALQAEAQRQLAAVGTRLNLVGKPLVIEGRLSDGRPLDWKAYRGKVVLVDFWTSWGRQVEEERVNQARARVAPEAADKTDSPEIVSTLDRLRRLYERHHDEGLEIIGVNLEKVQGDIDRFIAAQKLPWTNVTNLPGAARGTVESNAARCGVESPPMAVLVDRFGRVVRVGVLNDRFEKRVSDALVQRALKPRS